MLRCRVAFLVGDGGRVRFWKDKRCGDESLCISFPLLFVVASSKEAWVKEVWSHFYEGGGVGPLDFLGESMIGRWRAWSASF